MLSMTRSLLHLTYKDLRDVSSLCPPLSPFSASCSLLDLLLSPLSVLSIIESRLRSISEELHSLAFPLLSQRVVCRYSSFVYCGSLLGQTCPLSSRDVISSLLLLRLHLKIFPLRFS